MDNDVDHKHHHPTQQQQQEGKVEEQRQPQQQEEQVLEEEEEEVEVEDDEEASCSSESEIGDALDWLDSKDDDEAVDASFSLNSRRPNAHGGHHTNLHSSTLQPLSNRNQKFSHHIRASPLEVRPFHTPKS